jgi:hypothetical protein
MTFPDTVPAWMSETPPVPDCPPWCLEAVGHHDPTQVPGSWTRFHVAYRESFPIGGGDLVVEVASHQSWEGVVLEHEPAQLDVLRAEGLSPADALRLLEVLREGTATLTRITGGTAYRDPHPQGHQGRPPAHRRRSTCTGRWPLQPGSCASG